MCYIHSSIFPQCGHESTETRTCYTKHDHPQKLSTAYPQMGFCPTCFLLPDPRDSPTHPRGAEAYQGYDFSPFEFGPSQQVVANELWANAKEFMTANPEDLFAFARADPPNTGVLPPPARSMLKGILTHLLSDFWARLDTVNPCTSAERRLILQLHKATEFYDIKTAIMKAEMLEPRLQEIAQCCTVMKVEDVEAGHEQCLICSLQFGSPGEDGIPEVPSKVNMCGHIFGYACIQTWLGENSTCPMCRAEILPLEAPPEDLPEIPALVPQLPPPNFGFFIPDIDNLHLDNEQYFIEAGNIPIAIALFLNQSGLLNEMAEAAASPAGDIEEDDEDEAEDEAEEEDTDAMPLWMRTLFDTKMKRDWDFLFSDIPLRDMIYMCDIGYRPRKREQPGQMIHDLQKMDPSSYRLF